MLKKLLKFLNHERCQLVGAIFCTFLTVWGLSCESKVQSLRDPTQKVTRDELRIEVDRFLALAEVRFKRLDRLDELKALAFEKLLLFTQTGTFNPIGILPTVAGIMGIAAIADNVTKRKEIKKLNGVSQAH